MGSGVDALWAKVDKFGECWEWTGARMPRGYGRFRDGERTVYVHRFVWEQEYGPIPKGILVCHSCDNPPCVRPEHLFLGTQVDNMADMLYKHGHYLSNQLHCPQGHEYDDANTYRDSVGARHCRRCARERGRADYALNSEAILTRQRARYRRLVNVG